MKHVIGIIFAVMIALSACSSDEDKSTSAACIKAKEEHQKALDAYVAKVNQHPGPNAAPSVLEAHQAEVKRLYDIREEKGAAVHQACN